MLNRITVIFFGVAVVAVLSALGSQSRKGATLESRAGEPAEILSSTDTPSNCERPKQENQAGEIISAFDRLTYGNYAIQTRYKMAKLEVPDEYGPPPNSARSSYIVIKHGARTIARFEGDIYSPLGNSTEAGFFSLLHKSPGQLIVSQDISRTGVQWVADFSKGFKIIFDGQKFQVGREAADMVVSDLDGDGTYEITVPITNFYGFESWRLTTSETPLPDIIFRYDSHHLEYLPANVQFKKCLLKNIEAAAKNARALKEQPSLGRLMAITLDYVFVGEEQRGWSFFDETCKLPDKDRIKADMKKELKAHPVYRYVQNNLRSNEWNPGIRAVDFANYSYPGVAVYYKRKTFTLKDGRYEGLFIPGCKGSASDCHEPVSLVAQTYGDVTGDSIEEAMVVLTESIRGSAIPYYVYVFTMEHGRPKLLWAVATGDRAEGGLRKVYAEKGQLVIELYGNGARVNGNVFAGDGNGACCPLSVTRTSYRWNSKYFVQHGQSKVFSSGGNGAPLEMEIHEQD